MGFGLPGHVDRVRPPEHCSYREELLNNFRDEVAKRKRTEACSDRAIWTSSFILGILFLTTFSIAMIMWSRSPKHVTESQPSTATVTSESVSSKPVAEPKPGPTQNLYYHKPSTANSGACKFPKRKNNTAAAKPSLMPAVLTAVSIGLVSLVGWALWSRVQVPTQNEDTTQPGSHTGGKEVTTPKNTYSGSTQPGTPPKNKHTGIGLWEDQGLWKVVKFTGAAIIGMLSLAGGIIGSQYFSTDVDLNVELPDGEDKFLGKKLKMVRRYTCCGNQKKGAMKTWGFCCVERWLEPPEPPSPEDIREYKRQKHREAMIFESTEAQEGR